MTQPTDSTQQPKLEEPTVEIPKRLKPAFIEREPDWRAEFMDGNALFGGRVSLDYTDLLKALANIAVLMRIDSEAAAQDLTMEMAR